MNVLIVEDEELAAERLEELVRQYSADIYVLERIDTVKDTVTFIQEREHEIDLILLDIQLADGKSFEIFDQVRFYTPVIFTTAYDEFTLNAFKLNSIDYLLKPIKYEALKAALEKFERLKENQRVPIIDKKLISTILRENSKTYKKRFLVKFGKRMQFKNAEEIAYLYAEDKICHIVEKVTCKQYIIDHTLEELDDGLLDPQAFFRINRQFIINIDTIREVKSYYNNRLEVILKIPCEEKLIVSRKKVKDFKNWLNT